MLTVVDGITVLWGVRGAVGLFPCEGMTVHLVVLDFAIKNTVILLIPNSL